MRSQSLALLILTCVTSPLAGGTPPPAEVAVVCSLKGTATRTVSACGAEIGPLEVLDFLRAGDTVTTGEGATLRVVFADGSRFDIGPVATAVVGAAEVTGTDGAVSQLKPLPSVPLLARVASSERVRADTAATRVRTDAGPGAGELRLQPANNEQVLADEVVLRFSPLANGAQYRVTIEDETLDTVYATDTTAPHVAVRDDLLQPGREYYWSVVASAGGLPTTRAGAVFRTVETAAAVPRQALARQAGHVEEPDLQTLLAAVDLHLGLRRHACSDLAQVGTRPGVAEVMEKLGCEPGDPSR